VAGAAGFHRRIFGRHWHGDRRWHCGLDHDQQQPGRAAAAAAAGAPGAGAGLQALAAQHPAWRNRGDFAAGLPLLLSRRRRLRAHGHRADQLCRRGPVCPGAVWRHVLEGRHPARRAGRLAARLWALVLHADAAFAGQIGLARRRLFAPRPVGAGLAQARSAVWPERAGPPHARGVLEPAGQCGRVCAGLALAQPVGARDQPGAVVCRCV